MRWLVALGIVSILGMSVWPLASSAVAACDDDVHTQTVVAGNVTTTSSWTISLCSSVETLSPASAAPLSSVTVTLSEIQAQLCVRQEAIERRPVFETIVQSDGSVIVVQTGFTYVTTISISCEANSGVVRFNSNVVATATPAAGGLTATFTVPNERPGTYDVTVTPRWGTAGSATLTVLDTIPPFITGLAAGSVNAAGWYGGAVIVSFSCLDADSGIRSCTDPVTITSEGADQSVTGTAVDNAGNSATFTVHAINIDNTSPTIDPHTSRAPDHGAWYTAPVTITFDCADALSGIRSCTDPITLGTDGRGVQYRADAFDRAGNGLTFVGTVNIDQTPPTITAPANVAVGTALGTCGASPALGTAVANDNLGVVTVTNNAPAVFAPGTTSVTWTATDPAGHSASATQTVTVSDVEGPSISAPASITATATSAAGVVIDPATLGVPATADNCPGPVATTLSGVPAGNVFPIGSTALTWTATDARGNARTATQTVSVTYGICLLYDATRAARLGNTIPIKLQLCAGGTNLSSASLVPNATTLVKIGTSTAPVAEDSGNANPDHNFRYDPMLGGNGGYIYNLSTVGLSSGAWLMNFTVNGQTYSVPFQLR